MAPIHYTFGTKLPLNHAEMARCIVGGAVAVPHGLPMLRRRCCGRIPSDAVSLNQTDSSSSFVTSSPAAICYLNTSSYGRLVAPVGVNKNNSEKICRRSYQIFTLVRRCLVTLYRQLLCILTITPFTYLLTYLLLTCLL